jgi:hypothetical protein
MPIADCSTEIVSFHATKTVLCQDDQDTMRGRRDAGRKRLRSGLEKDKWPTPQEIACQGSYAMRTMVQDPQNDYDIDDGAYFSREDLVDKDGAALAPKAARQRVCDALRSDERVYPAKVRSNCVRQQYYDGYHIDVPVYRVTAIEDAEPTYELAAGDEWIVSDARAVTKWFNDRVGILNSGAADGSQMRRIVRLVKKLARSRASWKSETTSGICLTRLVFDEYEADDREDVALFNTLQNIAARLEKSSAIDHPIDGLLAGEGDKAVAAFSRHLSDALDRLKVLETDGCTRKDALSAWDYAFNTSYFVDQDSSAKAASIVVTSTSEARRNDGDRRFG